ncbi:MULTISPECIES: DUF554 domain-containing protein [unclassified Enterobacter]|uniref:DUF554 domain-containing protein n=1 Tax=unclassified Enterobacter TaxID=2608935 RepID=UPI0015CB3572|nr:hypothetical protein [Enterobacter sp. Sphag1F]NYI12977.1 hypothetical protein [Enterobacter sp. Sphag71]
MIIGPYANSLGIILGSLIGFMLARAVPKRLHESMPMVFGLCSMSMAVILIMKFSTLPVIILACIIGTIIGELIYVERRINNAAAKVRKFAEWLSPGRQETVSQNEFLELFVALIVLFCASGTGIVGALNEGMNGDASVLYTKASMDFFAALLFSTRLGYVVAFIAIPQIIIQLSLAYAAILILPLTSEIMRNDFYAVGGMLMMATGLRICGIKIFPIANMLPALIIVMPLSALWN